MSPILGTLTSRWDSDVECSNISFNKNRLDGVDMNSNGLDQCFRKNRQKIPWCSTDCVEYVFLEVFQFTHGTLF